jgi:Do/DeqQ family serine protease
MDIQRFNIGRRTARAGLAAAVALLLWGGAEWTGLEAVATPSAPASVAEQARTAPQAVGRQDSYADVVKVVAPAVVTIRTEGKARVSPTQFGNDDFFRRFFGDPPDGEPRMPRNFRQRALGSGVIVSPDGYILTNNHVVDGADDIKVELTDGRTLAARQVGSDKPTDLALLKVNGSDLHALALGDSDQVQVGDIVLAIGNPLGVGQTVTMGIISAKGRYTGVGDGSYEDFLQTDAPINHGNSGGALVSTRGELVGINSQILSNSDGNIGIGFAIPANMARNVMDQLRKNGRVERAQLGVSVQPVTSDMAESLGLKDASGAIVGAVTEGSAAARAGLKRGDIIKSFNGQPVHDTNSLRNRVAEAKPGSEATLVINRNGSDQTVTAKLDMASSDRAARGGARPDGNDSAALGVTVAPLTPELAGRAGVPKGTAGVLVEEVNPDGRAADAGIRAGDVIEEVNRQPVKSVEELQAAIRRTPDKPLLLLVNRQGQSVFVTVPAPAGDERPQ